MREKLIEILSKPIYPHELVDPIEAVADYLLDNDVVPVVRCKDCTSCYTESPEGFYGCCLHGTYVMADDFCSFGERKDNERKTD